MRKLIITNKTYKAFLLTFLILSLLYGLYSLIAQFKVLYLIPIFLSAIILLFILTGNKNLKLIIQISTGLVMIGCLLRLASIALLLIGQLFEEIKISMAVEAIIIFAVAFYLYSGSKNYIELKE